MYKIKHSSENISPFSGLNFIFSAIDAKSIPDFINEKIGFRDFRAKYSYSDIILSLLGNSLTEGEFVSDIRFFKDNFDDQIFTQIPSHDTIEYASQELKTRNELIITDKGIRHEINRNAVLNSTLPAICVKLGLLNSVEKYVLDYDNVILETEKQDVKKTYKMVNGYHPAYANIGNHTVFYECRNGNTPAKYGQKEALTTCFKNLKANGIQIGSFRGDSASYQKEIIELMEENVDDFYIRSVSSQSFKESCLKVDKWDEVVLNYEKKEVASIKYKPFQGEKEYRIVVSRSKVKKEEIVLFEEYNYVYFGIITNNLVKTEQEVIEFYNQRGNDSENNNKNLLNDFNLNHLPFMDMDTNSVYIGLMLICSNLFEWIKTILVKNKAEGIEQYHRTKRVFYRYISLCGKWIKHAGNKILKIYTKKKYEILQV
jgi:Transposase DDE domain group 1